MRGIEHNLPVQIEQILSWVRQCSTEEKQMILRELMDDTQSLTMVSEPSLSKDWCDADEDEAWKDL
ncbi:MAG: hypothetical protein JSS76_07245 [Bacteroidetes bacterium]|nr:hypothetical protein [Bacteroidota bacterium]MBS1684531.1 hypothetical protein [Bacteroidota bacterium]